MKSKSAFTVMKLPIFCENKLKLDYAVTGGDADFPQKITRSEFHVPSRFVE